MKKLTYKITLITLVSFSFKLSSNKIDQPNNIKESIRLAIKKSKPDLLKKALTNVKLTEKEKNWLSIFANEIIQIRKNKMNLNLIKPKRKFMPSANYFFAGIITFLCGSYITLALPNTLAKEKCYNSAIIAPIITGMATYWAIKKLIAIGKKKDEEYLALHPYRSPKQKYLDSINVLELIQTK